MFADHKKRAGAMEVLIAATGFDLAGADLENGNALADFMAGQVGAGAKEDQDKLAGAEAEVATLKAAKEGLDKQNSDLKADNAKLKADLVESQAVAVLYGSALESIGVKVEAAGPDDDLKAAAATAVDAKVAKRVAELGHGEVLNTRQQADGPRTAAEAWANTEI